MKPKDIAAVEKLAKKNKLYEREGKGLLFCPSPQEIEFALRVMNQFSFDILEQKDWDLNRSNSEIGKYDVALMCNMFMYSRDPAVWVDNLRSHADLLIMQDVIRCPRMNDAELGSDGDCSRFSFSSFNEYPRIDQSFDMENHLGKALIDIDFYSDDGNGDRDCRKFVALIDLRRIK